MNNVASEPPSLWQLPDIVGLLLLPVAFLLVLTDAIVLRGVGYGRETG